MKRSWKLVAMIMLSQLSAVVLAGDIYTCKGADGVNIYQNTPCSKVGSQISHNTYNESMAKPSALPLQATAPEQQAGDSFHASPATPTAVAQAAPQAPSAYQCTAGRRTWVQFTPCQATYTVGGVVDIEGRTSSGERVSGTGFVPTQRPVRQTVLDKDALCDKVRAGTMIAGAGSPSSQSYERNKIKRNQCGG